jgi:hypothetical protein
MAAMTRHKLAEATSRLNAFTDKLGRMADWRAELEARIDRATERFETVGLEPDELDAIIAEVAAFVAKCGAIAESIRPPRKEAA